MGTGILAAGIGIVRGTVEGAPMEGIPKVGEVLGVVVDVPPMVPPIKGVGFTPAMGLVGAV